MLANVRDRFWVYDLCKQAGVRSGVLYPMVHRWLDEGWLTDGWEEQGQGARKAPPRRFYRLTELGRRELAAQLAAMPAQRGSQKPTTAPKRRGLVERPI